LKPTLAYRPLSFRINEAIINETSLVIDQQNSSQTIITIFIIVEGKYWITLGFEGITKDFKQFIPRILYALDSKL
jgi:hypothetical protein